MRMHERRVKRSHTLHIAAIYGVSPLVPSNRVQAAIARRGRADDVPSGDDACTGHTGTGIDAHEDYPSLRSDPITIVTGNGKYSIFPILCDNQSLVNS